jgi:DNA replication and repair protein RecF
MYLKRLLLHNFRNYEQTEIAFSPAVNLIQGENGQGKTNLLEAIHLLSTGRSFRAHCISDLISFGRSYFYLEAEFHKDGIAQFIKVYYDENIRKVQYNQTVHPTLTSLLGILPSILLSPDDLNLINGNPAERRRFLDIHIAQVDPLYIYHLARYFKAMKQRNHLLRSKSELTIQAWEQMMAHSAGYLVIKRIQAIQALKASSSKWLDTLSQARDTMSLHYQTSLSIASAEKDLPSHFQQLWQKNRPREMLLGSTQIGPHRDDILIHLADKSAKAFASEGQKRSCISSLRFAQWEQTLEAAGHPPILGIDDFGIQLDKERQIQLRSYLPKFNQVFLTSPERPQNAFTEGTPLHVVTVARGMIHPAI